MSASQIEGMRLILTNEEIDRMIAKHINSMLVGVVLGKGWEFDPDIESEPLWTRADLEAEASIPGQPLTFTCVPPGSGTRMGINRDRDSKLDGDDSSPGIFNVDTPSGDCRVGPTTTAQTGAHVLFLLLVGLLCRFGVQRVLQSLVETLYNFQNSVRHAGAPAIA